MGSVATRGGFSSRMLWFVGFLLIVAFAQEGDEEPYFGPNINDVNCNDHAPCTEANTPDVLTKTCPPGTIGTRGRVGTGGQEGPITLVCHMCPLEGTYCDGRILTQSSMEIDVFSADYYCPGGSYCPNTYTRFDCPSSYYCRAGSSEPSSCVALSICPSNSTYPQQFMAYIAVLAFLGSIWVAYDISGHRQLKKTYRDRLLLRYVQKYQKPLRAWLASARHNLWKQNGQIGPDPLLQEVVGLEGQSCSKPQSFMTFAPLKAEHRVALETKDLCATLRSTGAKVLNNVNVSFEAGKLTGIFGPSGCGKSTLLTELLGRTDPTSISVDGTVEVNGTPARLNNIAKMVGFVPQDDILPEDLTVHDVIRYEEALRGVNCDSDMNRALRVEETEQLLDISFVKHSSVGAVDVRGISGGQRKRVSIAMELVTRPLVLVADELTTGLDATTAFQIMQALKRLCSYSGMTIIATIHQPRPQIFDLLDNVIVLAAGSVVYQGPPGYAHAYFENLGFSKPQDSSTPDFLLDVVSGLVPRKHFPAFVPQDLIGEWEDFCDTLQRLTPAQVEAFRAIQSKMSHRTVAQMAEAARRRKVRRSTASGTIAVEHLNIPSHQTTDSSVTAVSINDPTGAPSTMPMKRFASLAHKPPPMRKRFNGVQCLRHIAALQDNFWENFCMTIFVLFTLMYSISIHLQQRAEENVDAAVSEGGTVYANNTVNHLSIPIGIILAEGAFMLLSRLFRWRKDKDGLGIVAILSLATMCGLLVMYFVTASEFTRFVISFAVLLRGVCWASIMMETVRSRRELRSKLTKTPMSALARTPRINNGARTHVVAGQALLHQLITLTDAQGNRRSKSTLSASAGITPVSAAANPTHFNNTNTNNNNTNNNNGTSSVIANAGLPQDLSNTHSFAAQTMTFFRRSVRQQVANARLLALFLVLLTVLGAVVGLLFGSEAAFSDLPLKLLLATICLSLVAAASGMQLFSREKLLYYRERAAGTSALAYFVAKNLAHLPFGIMQPLFFLITFVSLSTPAATFWEQFVVFATIQFAASGIGMCVGIIFRRDASIALVCCVMLCVLFSTFNPTLTYFSRELRLGYYGSRVAVAWSYARWTSEALFVAEMKGYTPAYSHRVESFMETFQYNEENFAPNIVIALFIGLLLRCISYWVLTHTNLAAQGQVLASQRRSKQVS